MSIDLAEWARLFRDEYLSDFVPSGGSTAKVLVCDDDQSAAVIEHVAETSSAAGFVTVTVDAADTRAHMIDRIFFNISHQIDWTVIADQWLRLNLGLAGTVVPDGASLSDFDAIAEASGIERPALPSAINRVITKHLLHERKLSSEFRRAMTHYCISRVNPHDVSPIDAATILSWLTGEKASLVTLKNLRIYQRIGRHNARSMLISLARWLNMAGYPGLCLILDLTAAFDVAKDSTVNYTRAALLDLYEVLRQFIDETDQTAGLALIAIAGPGIVDDPARDYRIYDAFMLRVVNDVRDRSRDNPLNVLVRLTSPQPEGQASSC